MVTKDAVCAGLDAAGVAWSIVEHAPALTTQMADEFIEGHEGVRTKSLFIVNKKRTASYLLIMDDAKPLDLGALAGVLEETRLSIGSVDRLRDALDTEPGVVSPFALVAQDPHATMLLWDREMLEEPILTFHPGENTATIFVGTQALVGFFADAGVPHRVIDAPSN